MSSTTPNPLSLSEKESLLFHFGLPSGPILIARTGAPWKQPEGPDAYPHKRRLQVVGNHPIAAADLWCDQVGPKILNVLNEFKINWHTIDVVRIAYEDDSCAPPVVWIAVEPGTLTGNEGDAVAHQCQDILDGFGLGDVEVCIRGSKLHRAAASAFDIPGISSDPTSELRMPFTSAIGFSVSTKVRPYAEGSLGLFFINGSDTSKLYFLTARHVVFPPATRDANRPYEHNSTLPRHDVTIFGEEGIAAHLEAIQQSIKDTNPLINHYQLRMANFKKKKDKAAIKEAKAQIKKVKKDLRSLENLHNDRFNFRQSVEDRTLGFVTLSPPIGFSVGPNRYTEDWAIGQVNANKIDADFCHNVLDLGFEFKMEKLSRLTHPGVEYPPLLAEPEDRLLHIRGIVPDAELRKPSEDKNGIPYLKVLKRGKTTGLTIGHVNNIKSFIRSCWNDGTTDISMELPIIGEQKNKPFSENGDSGSVVVDGKGRVVGIITSGAGQTNTTDVTYATPAEFLFDRIKGYNINPNINFSLNAPL